MATYTNYKEDRGTSGDFKKIIDKETILKSIENIVTTTQDSRIFLPGFGTGIYYFLFEPLDNKTAIDLRDKVRQQLNTWDDRIQLQDVNVQQDLVNHTLLVNVTFSFNAETFTETIPINQETYEEINTDFQIPPSTVADETKQDLQREILSIDWTPYLTVPLTDTLEQELKNSIRSKVLTDILYVYTIDVLTLTQNLATESIQVDITVTTTTYKFSPISAIVIATNLL